MAHGTWGSRLPIGNLLFTWLTLLGMRWRVSSQRVRNRLREALARPRFALRNDEATTAELDRWCRAGFDRLSIGGGPKNLAGFINLDFVAHSGVDREVRANILDLSFIPSACAAQVHSNHVIEHLTRDEIASQLREYFRILRGGGLLTLRCPNVLGVLYAFWFPPVLEAGREAFVALGYPPEEDFGNAADGWLHRDFYGMIHWLYGDSGNLENQHLSRVTPSDLQQWVEAAGFEVLLMTAPEALNLVVAARKRAPLREAASPVAESGRVRNERD